MRLETFEEHLGKCHQKNPERINLWDCEPTKESSALKSWIMKQKLDDFGKGRLNLERPEVIRVRLTRGRPVGLPTRLEPYSFDQV